MSFKLKKIFLVQLCLSVLIISFGVFAAEIKPSDTLYLPTSYFAASSGAGASFVGDIESPTKGKDGLSRGDVSMMAANPATLAALKKQYTVFGNASWQYNLDLVEAGVFDSTVTSVAFALAARETLPTETRTRDRSIKVAAAYQLKDIFDDLILGLSYDFQQLSLTDKWAWQNDNHLMGVGALYRIKSPWDKYIFLGLSQKGLFDKYNSSLTDVGVSTTAFENYYIFNIDALIDSKKGFQSVVTGVNIVLPQYFELKGSIGYNPKQDRIFWGSGIFFKGPLLHLYYTLVKTDSDDTTLRQTAGLELAFSI